MVSGPLAGRGEIFGCLVAGEARQAVELNLGMRRWDGWWQRSRLGSLGGLPRAWGLSDAPTHMQLRCRSVQGGQFRLGHARAQVRLWQRQRRRLQQPLEHGGRVVAAIEALLKFR